MRLLTTLTTKGQITMPSRIRQKLNLRNGDIFLVLGKRNVVIFKKIEQTGLEKFEEVIKPFKKAIRKLEREI